MVAKVAVSAAVYAIDKLYSYCFDSTLALQPGMRVIVPFGKGNRRTEGIVVSAEDAEEAGLKCIERVLDESPVLDEGMLKLAAFMVERYYCTFYEAIKTIVPVGLWFSAVEQFSVTQQSAGWQQKLQNRPEELQLMQILTDLGGQANLEALKKAMPEQTLLKSLAALQKKKLIHSQKSLTQKVRDKTQQIVSLAVSAEEAMQYAQKKAKGAKLQHDCLELLCVVGSTSAKELMYYTGCSTATLRRLQTLGYVELTQQEILRRVALPAPTKPQGPIVLEAEQKLVYDGLSRQKNLEKPGVALLYGITGSGKTMIYLKLIADCLERGEGAMVLVPEIALTPQVLQLFASYFGDCVAVLHSSLQVGERYDEYKRIRSGSATVILGTRSAVFAPVQNLGLIIVDEEQEHTYKSENAPRYHAKEIAIYRGVKEHALVLLGSATPSMESMYQARSGAYTLYQLHNRFNGQVLPQVELVDMKQELKAGNGGTLSLPLQDALEQNLLKGQQSILFVNRRGHRRFFVGVDCGYVPQCPRCSVNLTYHAANHRLMCHYCGHSEAVQDRCPECGGPMKRVGFGTQKVEQELAERFPGVQVLRMDADTITASNNHETILTKFQEEKIPILLGTQMVTKGLNFETVTLVGVLDADMSLYVDNFRAAETTFSMLTQVVGRAGRGQLGGRAIIQTMTPEAAVLQLAGAQDYDRFYDMEIGLRQLRGSPPFFDLIGVQFSGMFDERVIAASIRFKEHLQTMLEQPAYQAEAVRLLGPAPAAVPKINNKYRYKLTICCKNTRTMRRLIAFILKEFAKDKRNKGVTAFADSNSYD